MAEACITTTIAIFDPFIDAENVETRWKSWLLRFENFLIAVNITNDERKKALLLHHAGEYVFNIYEKIFKQNDKYVDIIRKLNNHFRQKYQPNRCGKCGRKAHATNDQCPAIGKQCTKCKNFNHFSNVCNKSEETKINEDDILKIAEKISKKMYNAPRHNCNTCGRKSHESDEICPARGKVCTLCNRKNHFANVCQQSNIKSDEFDQKCRYCGHKKHENSQACPARDKHCKKCNKPNHFASVCKASKRDDLSSRTQVKITHVQNIQQTGPQFNFVDSSSNDVKQVFFRNSPNQYIVPQYTHKAQSYPLNNNQVQSKLISKRDDDHKKNSEEKAAFAGALIGVLG